METKIYVKDLKTFVSHVRDSAPDLRKELRDEFRDLASLIANRVQAKVPRDSGRAAASVKGASTDRSLMLRVGGNKAPYYPWLDFGGRVGRERSVRRPFIKEGRYVYPTLRAHRDEVEEAFLWVIEEVGKRAGFGVKGF